MDNRPELLPLGTPQRIILEHSPLVLVVCQIRFSAVLGIADPKVVAPFQRAIQAQYPIAKQAQQFAIQVGAGSGEAEIRQGLPTVQWQFSDETDTWTVVLGQESLAIETRKYERFEDFVERIRLVLDALIEHVQPPVVTRIGLRYINEIRIAGTDWRAIIRSELLGPISVPEFVQGTSQLATLQQVVLRYAEDNGVTMHHGLVPAGSTVKPRASEEPAGGPFYLLDADAFQEFPPPRTLRPDTTLICQRLDKYHDALYRLFRWSVTEHGLSALGRRNDDNR